MMLGNTSFVFAKQDNPLYQEFNIALIIDRSSSVNESQLEDIKDSSAMFARKILEQRPNTRIGVICIEGQGETYCNITNDIDMIESSIAAIKSGNGTNIASAIWRCPNLFSGRQEGSAQIVIILSDGVPSEGQYYDEDDAVYKISDYPDAYHTTSFFGVEYSRNYYAGFASATINDVRYLSDDDFGYEYITIRCPSYDLPEYTDAEQYDELGKRLMSDIATLGSFPINDTANAYGLLENIADAMILSNNISGLRQRMDIEAQRSTILDSGLLPLEWRATFPGNGFSKILSFDYKPEEWLQDNKPYNHEQARLWSLLNTNANLADLSLLYENLALMGLEDSKLVVVDYEGHTMHILIAHRPITINGEVKNMVYTQSFGTYGIDEWISNFSVSFEKNGEYSSFTLPAKETIKAIKDYQLSLGLDTDPEKNIYCNNGISRGAAGANLVHKRLVDSKYALPDQVFTYTFATPNVCLNGTEQMYDGLFNISNVHDLVPGLPPGCQKHGVTYGYGIDSVQISRDVLGSFGESLGLAVNIVTGVNGHFPDVYMALMETGPPVLQWQGKAWYLVLIACPVDVVLMQEGIVIASIIDGKSDNEELAFVYGEQKYLILPSHEVFTVEITATDSGEVDFQIIRCDTASNGTSDSLISEIIPIETGDVIISEISPGWFPKLDVIKAKKIEPEPEKEVVPPNNAENIPEIPAPVINVALIVTLIIIAVAAIVALILLFRRK